MAFYLRAARPSPAQLPFLALALSLALLATSISGFPVPDSSGEEELPEALDKHGTPTHEKLAQMIQGEAARLKEELCSKHYVCDNSMESLMENNLNLPKINEEDGCFKKGFRKEKCLRKITSSLLGFEPYLAYMEETFGSESDKVTSIRCHTKNLMDALTLLMRKPNAETVTPAAQEIRLTKPQPNTIWMQRVTARIILRDFTFLIQKTLRAVRFLSTSDTKNV